MKFYGTKDVNCFVEKLNPWQYFCRYPPSKTWDYRPYDDVRFVNVYRDYEGPWLPRKFTDRCYYLQNCAWSKNRIKPKAALPNYYPTRLHFTRIEHDASAGFKLGPFPMNLREVRVAAAKLAAEAKALLEREAFQKAILSACKRAKTLTGR